LVSVLHNPLFPIDIKTPELTYTLTTTHIVGAKKNLRTIPYYFHTVLYSNHTLSLLPLYHYLTGDSNTTTSSLNAFWGIWWCCNNFYLCNSWLWKI